MDTNVTSATAPTMTLSELAAFLSVSTQAPYDLRSKGRLVGEQMLRILRRGERAARTRPAHTWTRTTHTTIVAHRDQRQTHDQELLVPALHLSVRQGGAQQHGSGGGALGGPLRV